MRSFAKWSMAVSKVLLSCDLGNMWVPASITGDSKKRTRKIKKHGGLKRQLQYIGKLMRNMDVEFIQVYLESLKQIHQNASRQFHELEQWRDRLIDEGDPAINEILSQFPNADRQHLRQLVRKASAERKKETEPRAARILFRYLRELTENK